jgi:DNA-binding transcriptional ArsR family regulator
MLFNEMMKSRKRSPQPVTCGHKHAVPYSGFVPHPKALERAARFFRALGDTPRLRLLHLLSGGEVCVGELVAKLGEKFSTVSQRLRILRAEGLIARRRDGSHVYYTLTDDHVKSLMTNALAHADELDGRGLHFPESKEEEDDE